MTVLQSLDQYYARMKARGEVTERGFAPERISFAITLSPDGEVRSCDDLRETQGKRLVPQLIAVPAGPTRTSGILPNLLWDKSAYVLGRTRGAGRRTAHEHAAFRKLHLELLAGTNDPGLVALCRFLAAWTPERFDAPPFLPEMLDANIIFRLSTERGYLHDRPAARALVSARSGGGAGSTSAFCLVTGEDSTVARLHPAIKGVDGGQTSGGFLVSFNLDAFASYGKEQGTNAPTSEAAAFRYGVALNRLLERGGPNRVRRPIGDATVTFWADASEAQARAAENLFAACMDPDAADEAAPDRDAQHAEAVRQKLDALAAGRPALLDPDLDPGVRFHVLGLSPNAARLSVRFWLTGSFGAFARHLARHHADLAIEPPPWRSPPAVARVLVKTTAAQEKFDNIPHQLAGEVMRAILAGTPYPRTLLSAALMRIRAGDNPASGWHAAVLRAVLARTDREETPPLSLDRDSSSAAYQLGRMFAMAEIAQRMALGKVNASIRDRYFGAASATPASVFPLLLRGMQHHLSRLRKDGKGSFVEREMDEIAAHLPDRLPRTLRLEEQGRFVIGYYHQRSARVGDRAVAEIAEELSPEEGETDA